ncbi:OmpA family protein [Lentzea sp. NPDC060358]|uniref:OmpA family protein n=1 Tax=Lentzea sp. NPDC060358 TaxID=3347103 RepID=UPI00366342F2
MLLDASNSTRSVEAEKAPDYAQALKARLTDVVKARQTLSIGSFSGNATRVRWIEQDLTTDVDAGPENYDDAVVNATRCLQDFITKASADGPVEPGTDVLGAATAGFEKVRAVKGERAVILATDGLSTVGCASLEKAAIGQTTVLENIVSLCNTRGNETGKAPDGTKLSLVGVGHPAVGASTPSTGQLIWLGQLWTRLCETTGVLKENCAVDTVSVMGKAPQRAPSGNVADPEITFPKPGDGVDGDKVITWSLGDSDMVLFDFDSDQLRAEGLTQLDQVASKIKQYPNATTTVTGHTDARGTNEYNLGLSQRRAAAVRAALLNKGVTTKVETQWFGEEKPLCPHSSDEQAMKCNRRVEIVTNKGW